MKNKLTALVCALALLMCGACGNTAGAKTTAEVFAPAETADTTVSAKITVAGDLVMHMSVVNQGKTADGGYDFTPLFEDVKPYIEESDLALCCFEGAFAESNYSGYPMFLTPDGLAASLKTVGFDMVATASNHALDGRKSGLDRTLDVLDAAGLEHVGTYRTQEERDENHGVKVVDVNGISIAFLDYTYGTNGLPASDFKYGINIIYTDYMKSFNDIDYTLLDADMAYARSLKTDLIAVIAHWGAEYITQKQPAQEKLAEYWFSHGADIILGGHPHVPEPMETVTVKDSDGSDKTGFICYCLGNLLANMNEKDHKGCTLQAMLQLDISKNTATGKTTIDKAQYIPMAVIDTSELGITGAPWRFRIWDLNSAISDYESGSDRGGILTEKLCNTLKQYRSNLEGIMGTELEMRNDK